MNKAKVHFAVLTDISHFIEESLEPAAREAILSDVFGLASRPFTSLFSMMIQRFPGDFERDWDEDKHANRSSVRVDLSAAKPNQIAFAVLERANIFEEGRRAERLRQARLSFNAALILLTVGTVIVLCGVALLLRNHAASGIVSSAAGIVSNITSAVLFKFSKDANDRLDKIKVNLAKIETFQMALNAIDKIDDAKAEQP